MAKIITITSDEFKAATLGLVKDIRHLFGRAIEEDGRLCDASDAVDDLCDVVADRVIDVLLTLAAERETAESV